MAFSPYTLGAGASKVFAQQATCDAKTSFAMHNDFI